MASLAGTKSTVQPFQRVLTLPPLLGPLPSNAEHTRRGIISATMSFDTVAIVGVGLIGGSIGLAARKRRAVRSVVGVGRSRESLEHACQLGCIDAAVSLADAAAQADLVIVCTPVDRVAEMVRAAAALARPNVVFTDAGSTKDAIVRELDGSLPNGAEFVGSHPLAGSEKRGPEAARADLLDGRVVVVTPTASSSPVTVGRLTEFWQSLGARVLRLSPLDHDDAVATTSHLPHLAAAALVGILPHSLLPLAASGFRDTTRVAAGEADLWAAIFAQNRGAVLAALARYNEKLAEYRAAIEINDMTTLRRLLADAKVIRDAVG
ncbi:MAG: prephenate dehydrogenase/arogenate dehydrogenase family protein [Gemmataceae bacterium]